MNSERSLPSASNRSVLNRWMPRPERLIVLRKRAGMTLSVSMLAIGSGAATAVRVVKGSIGILRGSRHAERRPGIHDLLAIRRHNGRHERRLGLHHAQSAEWDAVCRRHERHRAAGARASDWA